MKVHFHPFVGEIISVSSSIEGEKLLKKNERDNSENANSYAKHYTQFLDFFFVGLHDQKTLTRI